MLSIRKLACAAQTAHYFEADDYYVGSDNRSPSAWWGRGAKSLGLLGDVDRADFKTLLDGRLPTGELLPARPDGARRIGYDVTFSAPKSVSLQALVASDRDVIEAHRHAVSTALSFLEARAARARLTIGETTTMEATNNLVVARFDHDTSRDLDPQLHTHAVILNATRREDGSWRAISNEALYDFRKAADGVYKTELAAELQELGYDVRVTHTDGRFEIRGYSDKQLRLFSKRRKAIEAALEDNGLVGARASEWAALITRQKKQHVDRDKLHCAWREEARHAGIRFPRGAHEPKARTRTQLRQQRHEARLTEGADAPAAADAAKRAIAHLTERRTVVSEQELLAQALGRSTGRNRAAVVFGALAQMRRTGALLDAKSESEHGLRFTTEEALQTEAAILAEMAWERIAAGQGDDPAALSPIYLHTA